MTTKKQYREQLAQDCNSAGINTVGLNELLDMAATLRHELEQLQSTVDLEGNKALGSEMSFIIILEVSPRYSVEPCLDAPAVTLDNDRIPFLPAEEFSPPQGKC